MKGTYKHIANPFDFRNVKANIRSVYRMISKKATRVTDCQPIQQKELSNKVSAVLFDKYVSSEAQENAALYTNHIKTFSN